MANEELDDLIEDLKGYHDGNINRYTGYKSPPKGTDSIRLSDVEPLSRGQDPEADDFFICDSFSWSDYSGSLVEKSNQKAFLDEFGELDGVHKTYGSYSSSGIAIRLDAITPEMIETFNALTDYPILNDDLHSEMEVEAQDEAWENWAKAEFVTELEAQFDSDDVAKVIKDDEVLVETLQQDAVEAQLEKADLWEVFRQAMEDANENWINEQGDQAYIDVTKVAKKVDVGDLISFGPFTSDDAFLGSAQEFAQAYDGAYPKKLPSNKQLGAAWGEMLGTVGIDPKEKFDTEKVWRRAALDALDDLRQTELAL